MNPEVRIVTDDGETLDFQLSNVDVSIANGLRRIMLSNIPTVVIKTFPHADNKCDIEINTTRLNNEILKQRLSCIPIHIKDLTLPLSQYLVSVDRKNMSNEMEYVTSGDFKIHTFTGPGTFTVNCVGCSPVNNVVDYLVIAGGGAGGSSAVSEGGGGGGAQGPQEWP